MGFLTNIRQMITRAKTFVIGRFLFRFQHKAYLLTFEDDLREWQPDVVHCNDWQTLSLGSLIKDETGSTLIFDSHELETHRNPPLPENRKRWMERYEAYYLVQCDTVTTVCEPISSYLSDRYGIERPLVVYNSPVYPNSYAAHEDWGRLPAQSDVRREAGLSEDDFLLVSVGNVTVNRGIENILEALPDLPDDVHLAIVGKAEPSFKHVLQEIVDKYGINQRVHFIKPVNPTCVVDFVKTADVGVISLIPETLSYDYALPNKLFECAYAGLVIVASDTQEVARKIREYNLGLTYGSGDVDDLRSKLLEVYHHNQQASPQKKSNKKFIKDHEFERCVGELSAKLEMKSDSI